MRKRSSRVRVLVASHYMGVISQCVIADSQSARANLHWGVSGFASTGCRLTASVANSHLYLANLFTCCQFLNAVEGLILVASFEMQDH
jgi:hypothetical protein